MHRKLPPDAFEFYFALGLARSYEAVAEKFGVSKRTVRAREARGLAGSVARTRRGPARPRRRPSRRSRR